MVDGEGDEVQAVVRQVLEDVEKRTGQAKWWELREGQEGEEVREEEVEKEEGKELEVVRDREVEVEEAEEELTIERGSKEEEVERGEEEEGGLQKVVLPIVIG